MQTPEWVAGRTSQEWNRSLLMLFGLLLLVGYVAAFNRAVLSLYVWSSGLLALFLLGAGLPHLNLRRKHIERRMPQEAVVGQVAEVEVALTNQSWLPAFVVQLTDRVGFSETPMVVLGTLSRIPGRGRLVFKTGIPCLKRGVWPVGPAFLESSFPLDLVQVAHPCDDPPSTLTVLPRTAPLTGLYLAGSSRERRQNELPAAVGQGEELVKGLRAYRSGDLPKHIHWRATARVGELVVKEYEPVTTARIRILLDLTGSLDQGLTPWTIQEAQVSLAASIALYALRHGIPVAVDLGAEYPGLAVAEGDVHETLRWFAGLPREAHRSYEQVLRDAVQATHDGESVFVFAATGNTTLSAALVALQAASRHVVLFLFDQAAFTGQPGEGNLAIGLPVSRVIPVHPEQSLEEVLNAAA